MDIQSVNIIYYSSFEDQKLKKEELNSMAFSIFELQQNQQQSLVFGHQRMQ